MPDKTEVKQPPAARDETADRSIHEAGEQRHAADVEHAAFGINPRANGRLENFHGRAGDVEKQDDLGLFPCLQLCREHQRLNAQRRKNQKVVARQRRAFGIPQVRGNDQRQHDRAEKAGPGLLYAKAREFVDETHQRLLRRPMCQPRLAGDEARQGLPEGGA